MQPENVDIRQKLEPFRRRWAMIALIVLAITAVTYYHYARQPGAYAASTQLFVRSVGPTPLLGSDPETDPARRLLNEAEVLTSPAVAARVAEQLGYKGDPRNLLKEITVTPSSDADLISLTATTPDPNRSAALANGFASAFAELSAPQNKSAVGPVVQVDRATVPISGSSPSPTRNALFAAVLGLVLAWLLVLGLEAFDRRLRQSAVEAEYGLPLLASIPFSRKARGATRSGSRLPVAVMERVRGLRTMLDHGGRTGISPRTVLITSAIPGEGKSTLAKSLAMAYFESGKSVLVIDADLRRPMLHEFFEAPLVPGLADVLRSSVPLRDAVQEVQAGNIKLAIDPLLANSAPMAALVSQRASRSAQTMYDPLDENDDVVGGPVMHLLASGSDTSDPAALLGSAQLKTVLAEAAANYDLVLLDSPPVLSVSDAIPLATAVDAVIVVARSEFTTRDAALQCRQALKRVPTVTVLGVVANGVRNDDWHSRPYYLTSSG